MLSYKRHFKLFLAFSVKHNASVVLSVPNLLGFLELLYQAQVSPRALSNYLAAIKAILKIYHLPTIWMDSPLISNFMRAVSISTPSVCKPKGLFSIQQVMQMSKVLSSHPLQHHFRVAFLLSFMAFLRISNLVPPTTKAIDKQKQLCWGDILFTDQGAELTLRWAKNLQKAHQTHKVQIPIMSTKWLCPVLALKNLYVVEKHSQGDLVLKVGDSCLTESHLRKTLGTVLRVLGIPMEGHSYHAFRRSGASLAFNQQVPFESIRSHGAWASDVIWAYLFRSSDKVSAVPKMFQSVDPRQ